MNVEEAIEFIENNIKDDQFESKSVFAGSVDKVMILTLAEVLNIIVFEKDGKKHLIKINCNGENVIPIE